MKKELYDKFKRLSDINNRSYIKRDPVSFDETDTSDPRFKAVYDRCKKYCAVAEKVIEKGIGVYLWGDKGTGKTHLSLCMAFELLNNYSVYFTTLKEIFADDHRESYKDADFLIIDDIGTEALKDWTQEVLYEIVNERYIQHKPTIYTSNYTLRELSTKGFAVRTLDRINESTESIRVEGQNYRVKIKSEREKLF